MPAMPSSGICCRRVMRASLQSVGVKGRRPTAEDSNKKLWRVVSMHVGDIAFREMCKCLTHLVSMVLHHSAPICKEGWTPLKPWPVPFSNAHMACGLIELGEKKMDAYMSNIVVEFSCRLFHFVLGIHFMHLLLSSLTVSACSWTFCRTDLFFAKHCKMLEK